jgi:hypothetical protein
MGVSERALDPTQADRLLAHAALAEGVRPVLEMAIWPPSMPALTGCPASRLGADDKGGEEQACGGCSVCCS